MLSGSELLLQISEKLAGTSDNSAREARILIHHLTGCDPRLPSFTTVTDDTQKNLDEAVERRVCGEPLQYILGEWEFMGIPLKVGKGVLCPRADSECLVERAIELFRDETAPVVMDLCAGTGALALGIKEFLPDAEIIAVEKYPDAYKFLEENLKNSGVTAILDDVGEFHERVLDGSVSLIISNPPYIPWEDKPQLSKELSYEPDTALFEPSYLYFYDLITSLYCSKLKKGGVLMFEIPTFKEEDVAQILKKKNFLTDTVSDYNKTIRGVYGIRR